MHAKVMDVNLINNSTCGRRRWVPGELLVFSGNSPLVGPCALGFLWNIPGQRQFLVPLHRCDLN